VKVADLENFVFATVAVGPTRISNAAVACLTCLQAFGIDDVPDNGERPSISGKHDEVDYWFDWFLNGNVKDLVEWAAGHSARWHHRLDEFPPPGASVSTTDEPSPDGIPG
jgi:hypothetical protein